MTIVIGCDPAGLKLKKEIHALLAEEHEVTDVGCYSGDLADYSDYADLVAEAVTNGSAERGILVCGTGVGMSIAANRHQGVRAVVASTALAAVMSREHNDSNVLCFGHWTRPVDPVELIVDAWIFGRFSNGEAHVRRINKMDGIR